MAGIGPVSTKNETVLVENMEEKPQIIHSNNNDVEVQSPFSVKERARIRRTVDYRVVPIIGLMLGIALMDRSNVSNAAIAGMREDLELSVGYRYAFMTSCFFITYVLTQAPMTWLTRAAGPRIVLPGVVFAWGVLIIGFGFAKHWTVLVGLRLILGVLEAGFFGGGVYLLQTWFTRSKFSRNDHEQSLTYADELSKRFTIYYFIGAVVSSFSGILAYGFMQMHGASGIKGWQWIFVMEGIVRILICSVHRRLMITHCYR